MPAHRRDLIDRAAALHERSGDYLFPPAISRLHTPPPLLIIFFPHPPHFPLLFSPKPSIASIHRHPASICRTAIPQPGPKMSTTNKLETGFSGSTGARSRTKFLKQGDISGVVAGSLGRATTNRRANRTGYYRHGQWGTKKDAALIQAEEGRAGAQRF